MDGPRVAATLERVQPIEHVTDEGYAVCRWPYYERSEKGVVAAAIWELDIDEECRRWGFPDYAVVKQRDALRHELCLLGPDSPAEYVYGFDSRLIGDIGLEDLGRDIVWFIKRMHAIYALQTGVPHGERAL